MTDNVQAGFHSLHPGAGTGNRSHMADGRVFSLYWSHVTRVNPDPEKDKFPKGHALADQPIPKRWVRCAMPWSSNVYSDTVSETYWCPVLSPTPTYEGETSDFTPQLDTPVLIAFVGNDYRYPVVLGYYANTEHDYKTGRADLKMVLTRAGHVFIVDSEQQKSLKKVVTTSSAGHRLAMIDQDQKGETEESLKEFEGVKRQVYLRDFKGQQLTFFCPESPDVPVYAKLENAEGTHILHMQAEPTRFATFSDIEGQFWKFDTDAQQFFLKANQLVDIKSDKAIQVSAGSSIQMKATTTFGVQAGTTVSMRAGTAAAIQAGTSASVSAGAAAIVAAPVIVLAGAVVMGAPMPSFGGGGGAGGAGAGGAGGATPSTAGAKRLVLHDDVITGTIFDSHNLPCTFQLRVQSSASGNSKAI